MPLNPDDPTVPIGLSISEDNIPQDSHQKSSGSTFMRYLHDGIELFVSNRSKIHGLLKEIRDVNAEIESKSQLSAEDFDKLDQLAAASDKLKEANREIAEIEKALSDNAPSSIKSVLAKSPLIIESKGMKIKVSSDYNELFSGHFRVLVSEITE